MERGIIVKAEPLAYDEQLVRNPPWQRALVREVVRGLFRLAARIEVSGAEHAPLILHATDDAAILGGENDVAFSSNSASVFAANPELTTITLGCVAAWMMGAKSRSAS